MRRQPSSSACAAVRFLSGMRVRCAAPLHLPPTCLFACAEPGNLALVDGDGNTVLHHALLLRGVPEVYTILAASPPLGAANAAGDTPLHLAARTFATCPAVDVLLGKLTGAGVDVNARDSTGQPPLVAAVSAGNTAAVQLLLTQGADASAMDAQGRTALHHLAVQTMARLEALRSKQTTSKWGAESGEAPSLFQQLRQLTLAYSQLVPTLVVRCCPLFLSALQALWLCWDSIAASRGGEGTPRRCASLLQHLCKHARLQLHQHHHRCTRPIGPLARVLAPLLARVCRGPHCRTPCLCVA